MKKIILIFCLLGIILISAVTSLKWRQISDVTTTLTEINFVHGLTSAIQTQLNSKLDTAIADARYIQIANGDTADYYTAAETKAVAQTKVDSLHAVVGNNLYDQINLIGSNNGGKKFKYFPVMVSQPVQTQLTLVDGRPYAALFTVFNTDTITGVSYVMSTPGIFTANGYNGFKLYSVNATTNVASVIDSTLTDDGLWKVSAYIQQSKAFTSPRILTRGVYLVRAIWNTSDGVPNTVPVVYNHITPANSSTYLNGVLRSGSYQTTNTSLWLSNTFDFDLVPHTNTTSIPGIWLYK